MLRRLRGEVRCRLTHLLPLLAVLPASGCGPSRAALPGSPPYLVGVITRVVPPHAILVEGRPGEGHREDRAEATVTPRTTLLWRDGRPASRSDLVRGRAVSLWITGPVLESYPVQVEASAVVLEPGQ